VTRLPIATTYYDGHVMILAYGGVRRCVRCLEVFDHRLPAGRCMSMMAQVSILPIRWL
jgi:hypothetical protein